MPPAYRQIAGGCWKSGGLLLESLRGKTKLKGPFMNPEQIQEKIASLGEISTARSGDLFAIAADLRGGASPHWPAAQRALAKAVAVELAARSSGRLKAYGLLSDLGEGETLRILLLEDSFWTGRTLRCAAACFRHLGRRRSQEWAHALADLAEGEREALERDLVAQVKARLFSGIDFEHDFEPAWAAPARKDLVWPNSPVAINGLAEVCVRPLLSSGQIDRATHHLRNCLASHYKKNILEGRKKVATIELNGVPVEALEVDVRSGRVLQWKAAQNAAPDAARRRVIENQLLELKIVAGRPI
jgi:hypothetical protein